MTPIFASIDAYILTFSAATVIVTIWMGFWSAKKSRTASDFFVAGRSVSVGWNASAISGEYLSAASFMGVAGMVMSSGYDALWYPVCYACGYLFLLLFIAGPLRRFGAYTIPDFTEGRYDSPLFRKIAVCFVLFIGFFYTMPQMKGAGTTLAYIFPGLPYWAGVVLVGAVITLNVALGGMKGITLVQAFQYWAKMFAISVPIFVLMAVYGHYGKQLELNNTAVEGSATYQVQQSPRDEVEFFEVTSSGLLEPAGAGLRFRLLETVGTKTITISANSRMPWKVSQLASNCAAISGDRYFVATDLENAFVQFGGIPQPLTNNQYVEAVHATLSTNEAVARSPGTATPAVWLTNRLVVLRAERTVWIAPAKMAHKLNSLRSARIVQRETLPAKAPADATWLSPFGPLTTKAAKAAAAAIGKEAVNATASINSATAFLVIRPDQHSRSLFDDLKQTMELAVDGRSFSLTLPGPTELTNILILVANDFAFADIYLERDLESKTLPTFHIESRTRQGFNREFSALLKSNGLALAAIAQPPRWLVARPGTLAAARDTLAAIGNQTTDEAGNQLRDGHSLSRQNTVGDPSSVEKAWLAEHEKPLALLYTYSLIIALVCGTAGLPHILVRFYTNPDGVAAKRTTMWVMILIGIFYVFPPVFGVMGRNLFPELYSGIGVKGTDKIVLELPRLLNEKYAPLGSILSGITCAGAFAAFMSTFSGLLVSMTGALAHDVYGRMLRPKSTPEQRMRMFRIGAVALGAGAIIAGSFVEPLQINFMVGQAFAIAAASYFPLLFMSAWWRGMTMKGAATGMLTGGLLALTGISLTSFSDLALATDKTAQIFAVFKPLNDFWAQYPLLRILCEQPAIWTVPLAIALMVIVSKLTRAEVASDIRMKMLVLHAPEKLGLKQEYIQEHQHGH